MDNHEISRRSFLKSSAAGASAFTIVKPELLRGAGAEKLKAGLVGCGGRGTQAVADLLEGCPNAEVVAMADVFGDRIAASLKKLSEDPNAARVKVDSEHRFDGLDGYKKILASDIDIVMLATPPGFRPVHFEAAVEAKKHVFCEKPFGTDPVGVRRFMAAAKKSEELKLTVKSGAQRRSQRYYLNQWKRVKDGELGEIVALNANWVGGPVLNFMSRGWEGPAGKRDPKWGDMEFQVRNWYAFVWICGDQIVEQHLHNLDVCNWFMGAHPVEAIASGGAAWRPREEEYGNIYDHLYADFVYPNGVRMASHCRQYRNAPNLVNERIVGTKGTIDTGEARRPDPEDKPYVQEHVDMMASILGTGPYINEAMAVAESTMTAILGREAAYSGKRLTWDQIMNSQIELVPQTLDLGASLHVPPLAVPGVYKIV
jgi:predicted dehydrogenase